MNFTFDIGLFGMSFVFNDNLLLGSPPFIVYDNGKEIDDVITIHSIDKKMYCLKRNNQGGYNLDNNNNPEMEEYKYKNIQIKFFSEPSKELLSNLNECEVEIL